MNTMRCGALPLACLVSVFFFACNDNGSNAGTDDNSSYVNQDGDTVSVKIKSGSFKDSRDGKTYRTVQIGEHIWMAENLNYRASGVCYENSEANCDRYGRLYAFEETRSSCPAGWHVPYEKDWLDFLTTVKGLYPDSASYVLKSTTGWEYGGNGSNALGFNVLPGGYYSEGYFSNIGYSAAFWINEPADEYHRREYYQFNATNEFPELHRNYYELYAYVRCINDTNTIMEKLPACDSTNSRTIGSYKGKSYICDDWIWRLAEKTEALGTCSDTTSDTLKTYNDTLFVCNSFWQEANLSLVFGKCNFVNEGSFGLYLGSEYVCNDSLWRHALDVEIQYGMCNAQKSQRTETVNDTEYFCNGSFWHERNVVEKALGFCTEDGVTGIYDGIDFSCYAAKNLWYGTITDARDGNIYKVVPLNDKIWMAENLDYAEGVDCSDYKNIGCRIKPYGGFYSWAVAMALPDTFNSTDYEPSEGLYQGICPSGWHLPDTTDWLELEEYVKLRGGIKSLFSSTGWKMKNPDSYGFGVVPVKQDGGYLYTKYWSVGQTDRSTYGKSFAFEEQYAINHQYIYVSQDWKSHSNSVRCIKN